ncbi:MAG: hypothetical protein RL222_1914 [Bacteroidota bacterium]|jgi:hypothetical protein
MFETPVLFLVFNRLDATKQVFAGIRDVQPKYLFIAADGPRNQVAGEAEKTEAVRNYILERIDWPCEVKTLFRDTNLGCGKAVSGAITWFFEHVEEGIILEDDTLPSKSFFPYCEELLHRYRDDSRIGMISGNNFQLVPPGKYDYIFTKYVSIWGWATWKRAWSLYDYNMNSYRQQPKETEDLLRNTFGPEEMAARSRIFVATAEGKIDTWDHQWFFCCLLHHLLTIVPASNLISNIGFGEDATHTTDATGNHMHLQTCDLHFPLKHPSFIVRSEQYENALNRERRKKTNPPSLTARWAQKLKTWLHPQ